VLFGFYQNFFATVRECYAELGRPADAPLATWRSAFEPALVGVEQDLFDGTWGPWLFAFPRSSGQPGSGGALPSASDYVQYVLQMMVRVGLGFHASCAVSEAIHPSGEAWRATDDEPLGGESDPRVVRVLEVLQQALAAARVACEEPNGKGAKLLRMLDAAQALAWPVVERLAERSRGARLFFLGLDFSLAYLRGLVVDGALAPDGLPALDDEDFCAWLLRHGMHRATLDHPLVRTVYDAAFSYDEGDVAKQGMAAGTAIRCLLRAAGTFKGALYYRMTAGMGDAVFAPLYEVLKRRGVHFEFFNMVRALRLSPDRKRIAAVELTRQAKVRDRANGYQPLIDVKGLPCWPSRPLYAQLSDGDALAEYDLESYYTSVPPTPENRIVLRDGADFDQVVFGIPIGAVPYVAAELCDASPRWRAMVQNVKSVQTAALQLWMKRDLKELGWSTPAPLLSLYVYPMNTWADMSQVLPREEWSPGNEPRSVAYFCGPQAGPALAPPPFSEEGRAFERSMREDARRLSLALADRWLTGLWPLAVDPAASPALDWNLTVDPQHRHGSARLEAQYYRSNCGPADRCTLALPGTNRYRIKAGETGFANLVITGDWIDNGIYAACMEGTVISGILAARAVTGEPVRDRRRGPEPLHRRADGAARRERSRAGARLRIERAARPCAGRHGGADRRREPLNGGDEENQGGRARRGAGGARDRDEPLRDRRPARPLRRDGAASRASRRRQMRERARGGAEPSHPERHALFLRVLRQHVPDDAPRVRRARGAGGE